MSFDKPFYRIDRGNGFNKYILDSRYADDRRTLCRAFNIILKDLEKLFEYVEPCDDNLNVYSHKTYELLLRSATEFETNCKSILRANGYRGAARDITDYFKINRSSKLSEYKVVLETWQPNRFVIIPFDNWRINHQLSWYHAYNTVKHHRHESFSKASLDNTIKSIAGLFVILFSQFGIYTFHSNQDTIMYQSGDGGSKYVEDSLFSIVPPVWSPEESYVFNWSTLEEQPEPFEKYTF